MGIFTGLKELIRNFTGQINDNNFIDQEISDENFMKLAMANGISPKDIAELNKTRNGIKISTPKEDKIQKQNVVIEKGIKKEKIKEKGRDLER